jgi:hypothetical protein
MTVKKQHMSRTQIFIVCMLELITLKTMLRDLMPELGQPQSALTTIIREHPVQQQFISPFRKFFREGGRCEMGAQVGDDRRMNLLMLRHYGGSCSAAINIAST